MVLKRTILFISLLLIPALTFAQSYDYLDVAPGYETLNLAVEADTNANGEAMSQNRAYRLERGGTYLLNGDIRNVAGAPLRIVAAEGDGPLPMLIPAAGEGGESERPIRSEGDMLLENIYVTAVDNLGNLTKNLLRINEDGVTTTIQGCYLDYDSQSLFRLNADDLKVYVYDSILRNPALLADPGNGRIFDTRGNTMDEIVVKNSTLYSMTYNPIRSDGGLIHKLDWDHVTVFQAGAATSGVIDGVGESIVELERVVDARVTNSIFLDVGYEGHNFAGVDPADDVLDYPIIGIDSLNAPEVAAESERMYVIKNNMYGFTAEIESFFDSHADLESPVFINARGQSFIDTYGWVSENNVEGTVEFTDGPGNSAIVAFAEHRYNDNYENNNNPDPRADRNGLSDLQTDPASYGPAEDDYDFDYSTSAQAYTMAEGGFPLGDLNWFPSKKAEWEDWDGGGEVEFDYLDVAPGYETLNLAVEADTNANGEAMSQNRAYRLERGGTYLLNGDIRNVAGAPLRIVAAEGDGPLPMLIPAAGEGGESERPIRSEGDMLLENIYVTAVDNLGNLTKNLLRINEDGVTTTIQGCYLDYDSQSLFRLNADDLKVYVYDSILRNPALLADPGNGRIFDTRGNTMDEIVVKNSTLYSMTYNPIRSDGGLIHKLDWDHVTVFQAGAATSGVIDGVGESIVELERVVDARVTNSIFLDVGYEGHNFAGVDPADDVLDYPIIGIDSLNAPEVAAESERMYVIKNNMYGFTAEIESFFDSHADLESPVFINARGQSFIDTYGWVSENNVEGTVEFTDGPGNSAIVAFAEHRYNDNYENNNNPDPRADRNGLSDLQTDPASYGPAEDDYDFDYSTSAQAYTMAEGGFPLGDLNWFPSKKAEWEDWVGTGVESKYDDALVTDYSLEQNYPNPFNPTTNIVYSIPEAATVKLTVYNILGEQVTQLVNKEQISGQYTVTWDGKDAAGNSLASGIYIYHLNAKDVSISKKMILMK